MTLIDPRTMANAVRFLSIDAIERVGEGHPGTPLGAADTMTALFTRHLKFNPQDPLWFDRDRFVQSSGHGSMLLYSLLHLSGYEKITIDEIKRFRELGSRCEGHPELDPTCGIEITTGPLGQGIANARVWRLPRLSWASGSDGISPITTPIPSLGMVASRKAWGRRSYRWPDTCALESSFPSGTTTG
ncbi:hypothetical protein MAE02_02230 [Microvirga aerophila]|uniref:Transketolase N-terminal domain-containing protein n=1 Tax=Microvirga aerophila TaxID=670291 RepID=A0A512BL02_9HYPH|nr:hypothetical protein MAE02_02230 [Microvirga aerophila]